MLKCTRAQLVRSVLLSSAGLLAACSSASNKAPSSSSPLEGTMAPLATPVWANSATFTGRVSATQTVTLQVHLAMHNADDAKATLAAISDPDNAAYGQFLSDADFAAKYAPTADDVATVRAHLEANGLSVTQIPSNNAFIAVTGPASAAEAAFGTQLGQYTVKGETRQAPMTAVSLPAGVSSRVHTVLGLSSPAHMGTNTVYPEGVDPSAATPTPSCSEWFGQNLNTTGPAYGGGYPSPLAYYPCGYKPAELRQAYGVDALVRKGNDGTGQKVAIVDAFTPPTLLADVQTYFANNDADYPLATSQLTLLAGPGTLGTIDTGWYGESSLDVEAVHAMAPGADIVYVGAVSANDPDLIAAINMIVAGHLATVISNSYGGIEMQTNDFAAWESLAIQAGLKGIGLYFASGDSGDNSADNAPPYGPGGPSASFPASLTEVTAVGGTSLALGSTGQRLFEVGWESGLSMLTPPDAGADGGTTDAASTFVPGGAGDFLFGAGGGVSEVYLQPTWQAGIVPASMSSMMNATDRVIPDVAMLADPYTGYIIGMSSPRTGVYSESGIGGTSLATPLFTGTVALAQQYAGKAFGSANAMLYKASKKSAFTDIKPGAPEAVSTLHGNVITFDYHGSENAIGTAIGYDNVTGLGVPNGTSFFSALK